ncbi:MAG: O-antigen ligase family protein [Bacteroidota bacterium]
MAADALPSVESVRRWGERLLGAFLVLGLGSIFALGWAAPTFIVLLPLVLIAGGALAVLVRHPLAHLSVVLVALVFVLQKEEGVQITEALCGVYYLSYLGSWFVYHAVLGRERLLRTPLDCAVALLLVFGTASLVLVPFTGGLPGPAVRQWMALVLFAFYFPIKEALVRERYGVHVMLGTLALIVLILALQTFYNYATDLREAEHLWQIANNREREHERFLMIGLLGSLVFLLYFARTLRGQVVALVFAAASFAGVAVGLSRAVWLAVAAGLGVLFLIVEGKQRVRLVAAGALGVGALLAVGTLLLGDAFSLVIQGLAERFSTIGSAGSKDVSLINRFYEWRTALELIAESPIIGRGLGVPFDNYTLIYYVTENKFHIHNAFLGMLYRHGIVGLGLFVFILVATFGLGVRLTRRQSSRLEYALALTAVTVLPALCVAALTEGMMMDTGGVFALMLPAAFVSGLGQRHRHG